MSCPDKEITHALLSDSDKDAKRPANKKSLKKIFLKNQSTQQPGNIDMSINVL